MGAEILAIGAIVLSALFRPLRAELRADAPHLHGGDVSPGTYDEIFNPFDPDAGPAAGMPGTGETTYEGGASTFTPDTGVGTFDPDGATGGSPFGTAF